MNADLHKAKCNIIVGKDMKDRFFMDMSVYEIKPFAFDDRVTPSKNMLWRGIYLAIRLSQVSLPTNQT